MSDGVGLTEDECLWVIRMLEMCSEIDDHDRLTTLFAIVGKYGVIEGHGIDHLKDHPHFERYFWRRDLIG